MRLLKSLGRGLAALDFIAISPGPVRLTDVANHLGVDKSNASHVLRTLVASGYVSQSPARRYALAGRMLRPQRSELVDVVERREKFRDTLVELVDISRECAHMAVQVGRKVWYIDKIPSPLPLKVDHPIGSLAPLHCTALGKAFLAFGDTQDAGPLDRYTARTITNAADLQTEIESTRARGYAIDAEEFSDGISCVAAPIFDADRRMAAAIGLSGPAARNNPARLAELGQLLIERSTKHNQHRNLDDAA